MNAGRPHREIEELLGVYALDALEADEAALVEEHLATCPRCRGEVDGHHEIAAALGNSVEPLPPPLWDRLSAHLDQGSWPTPLDVPRSASAARPDPDGRPRHLRRWAAVVGVAAAALAIALLGLQAAESNPTGPPKTPAQVALSTPGHRLVELTSAGGRRLAEVVVLPDGRGLVISNSLAPLPVSQTYQLWAMIGGRAISLGLLGRQPGAAAFTVSTSARPAALALTVEPARGVTAPDRAPVASGAVPA